ncbi:LacI family DNA-binding transcriptional regulator [Altererythrobacter aurantiacus]|uniref:LacI family DNA-binding transcriptional regulator n=1 Tax=Parapontixanthobacter aurantiacus TaxID=1463599 RepID=A0A844ZFV3_9SPHN|nr:LacI family DNA-binding transcriptional regulator [Parapontixanthobacter aurantiacus]MXO85850.1 LacI family DNA-binding transcriptional regulator [Parapontixanthobacter aurantiacus]
MIELGGTAKLSRKRSTRRNGNNAPTIADVARAAQCSPMTVSRVINGEQNVRENTREQVLAAIEKLHYVPNRAARSLAGGSQLRIALLFDNPSASYLSEFLMGALEEASRRDIYLVVQSTETQPNYGELIRRLIEGGIAGFILPPPLCDDQTVLDEISTAGAIAVAVGPGKASGSHGAVLIDEFQAAFDMTSHIIGLGHERIGFIIGNPEQAASEYRLRGYREAMEKAGLTLDDSLVVQGQFTYRSGMVAAEKLLRKAKPPTAIFASNDDMAAATVAMAHRRHLDVPNDITVCGFDDTELASSIWPELTTIRQPIREMTTQAVSMIAKAHKKYRGGRDVKGEQLTLPYKLIRRNSDAGPSLASSFNKAESEK